MAERNSRKEIPQASLPSAPSLARAISTWPAWLPRAALIAVVTLWIYGPALEGGLIWDDQWYVQINPQLKTTTGLWKYWFQPGSWVEYYPIQETVLWLQYHLFGEDTLGYHLTNLLLHLVNAFLVWRLLARLGLRQAWLGGLIFAIHPVQVDTVAYICELKNTLSLAFALVAMMAWIDYEDRRLEGDYSKAVGFYFLSMLCKISMAPFPAVILLYARWKRGRIGLADLRAVAPILAIAIVLAAVTIWSGQAYQAQAHRVIPNTPLDGPLSRLDAIGLIAMLYFTRCFLPVDMLLVYPQWNLQPLAPLQWLPWLAGAGVLVIAWQKRAGWGRHVLLGLGFFFLLLAPFLGFIAASYMNFVWALDHMLYLPVIGLIALVVAGVEGIGARLPASARGAGVAIVVVVLAVLAWTSHTLAGYYSGDLAYWSHILQRNPDVWIARTNMGSKFLELERAQEALDQENVALALRPDSPDDYYKRGLALEKLGRPAEAQAAYETALRLDPQNPQIYLNLGEIHRHAGDLAQVEAILRAGWKAVPDDASIGVDLAGVFLETGRLPEAIETYRHVADNNPDFPQVQYNLGKALLQAGQVNEAIDHLTMAIDLDPKLAAAHDNLGSALAQTGHLSAAIGQFQAALLIDPGLVPARNNLALALAQTGQVAEAIEEFQHVLQIDPGNTKARDSLAKLQTLRR